MKKKCIKCGKLFSPKIKANNIKYCSKLCRYKVHYEKYGAEWARNKRGEFEKGKVQCLICGKWYHKPISHTWQAHGIMNREYKKAFGLDIKKGILSEKVREIHRKIIKDHWDIFQKNLKKGKKYWFKKGDMRVGRYERSPQTKERLKLQGLKLAKKYVKNKKSH